MRLQVSLKLKLSKQIKKIKVKYNTFEKATYDEYLISSLALRTADKRNREELVQDYINDITGDGSLNSHFKTIYARIKTFSVEQLQKIMGNSMIPTLKIDEKNRYEYYPQLGVSVFQNKIYKGDLGTRNNLQLLLMIDEEIIDLSVDTVRDEARPEQFSVLFDERGNVMVQLLKEYIAIPDEVFEETLCLDLGNIRAYGGKVRDDADGTGWRVLTNSALNNLFSSQNFYYEEGDHYLIRNDSARKTAIAKVHGLYIYKEEILSYQGNASLCNRVIDFLLENRTIGELKPKSLLVLLRYVDDKKAQKVVNSLLVKKEDKEVALYGLDLMSRGVISGWLITALKIFLKYATGNQLNLIYQANTDLNYSLDQLVKIDRDMLSADHRAQVEAYNANLEAKRRTIREITGEITTKGLREKAKDLESDDVTKKFSKLCNRLIGHVNIDLDDASLTELEQWHKDALELKDLGALIQRKLGSQG